MDPRLTEEAAECHGGTHEPKYFFPYFFPLRKKTIIQFFKSVMDFDYHYFFMTRHILYESLLT